MRFLTEEEVEHLTGYRAARCQRQSLMAMGVRFHIRPKDGKPVVLHEDVRANDTARKRSREPAWPKAS